MEREGKELTKEIARLCYHYPGVNWDQAWGMSSEERVILIEHLKEIIEQRKKASRKG